MIRRLVIFLVLLAGLAALADRGLASLAGDGVASAVRRAEGLPSDPDVTFRGFPFLTQAIRGEFREVDVEVADYQRSGLRITHIDATLKGVEVSIRDALDGHVEAVPIESGVATVRLDFADLNQFLAGKPGRPILSPVPTAGEARLTGDVAITGVGTVRVTGRVDARVDGSKVIIALLDVRRSDGAELPSAVRLAARSRLTFTLDLAGLPFGIRLERARFTDDGVLVTASAKAIIIRSGG